MIEFKILNILTTLAVITVSTSESATVFPWREVTGILLHLSAGPDPDSQLREFYNPTTFMDVGEVITYHEYPYENHTIITSDGYILQLDHIPHNRNSTASKHKEPVILIPALFAGTVMYVMAGTDRSPGFILSDAGYDVWMLNCRGTRFGRRHTSLSPDFNKEFWDYSYQEIGIYDVTAAVDYILSITGCKQVFLMGCSMGTTITTVFLAEKPDYEDKIKGAFLLSPAIYLGHTKMRVVQDFPFLIEILLLLSNEMEFLPYSDNAVKFMLYERIRRPLLFQVIATMILGSWDPLLFDKLKSNTMDKLIAGASVRTVHHFMQSIRRHDFAKYDFGPARNMKEYSQTYPPQFNLGAINVPVYIVYGQNDHTVDQIDVQRTAKSIKSLTRLVRVPDDTFDHHDFILSPNVRELVFDSILDEMEAMRKGNDRWKSKDEIEYFKDALYTIIILMAIGLGLFWVATVVLQGIRKAISIKETLNGESTSSLVTAESNASP